MRTIIVTRLSLLPVYIAVFLTTTINAFYIPTLLSDANEIATFVPFLSFSLVCSHSWCFSSLVCATARITAHMKVVLM